MCKMFILSVLWVSLMLSNRDRPRAQRALLLEECYGQAPLIVSVGVVHLSQPLFHFA